MCIRSSDGRAPLAWQAEACSTALNRIQKESDRLNALVGQLLQVTRVEGDAASLRRDPLRLDQLVQLLVEESAIEAAAHGCSLQYQSGDAVTIAGDPELLRRAVENVLRNAIRYEPRDSSVEVRLRRGGSAVVVEIRDHGPGVPEEALPRIFDPFYRVESDRNRLSGGIGLGLSIARRAVELHHGTIRASNANPGLRIELEFPIGGRPETKPLATDEHG